MKKTKSQTYYVKTIGSISDESIKKYIEGQNK